MVFSGRTLLPNLLHSNECALRHTSTRCFECLCESWPGVATCRCHPNRWHVQLGPGAGCDEVAVQGGDTPLTCTLVQLLDDAGAVVAEREVNATSGGPCPFPSLIYGVKYSVRLLRCLGTLRGPASASIAAPYVCSLLCQAQGNEAQSLPLFLGVCDRACVCSGVRCECV
jgi:hypothetical protein